MKRIITFISLSIIALYQVNAQCTPVEPQAGSGVFPTTLDLACENREYTDTLTLALETTIDIGIPVLVSIDSVKIDSIEGLPNGAAYDCHNGTCTINNGGGDLMYGCLRLFGTPTEAGSFPLTIHFTAYAFGTGFPESSASTVTIQEESSLACLLTAQDELNAVKAIQFYPNPAHQTIHFEKEVSVIKVLSLSGQTILETTNKTELNTSNLKVGMYQLYLDRTTQNLIIE